MVLNVIILCPLSPLGPFSIRPLLLSLFKSGFLLLCPLLCPCYLLQMLLWEFFRLQVFQRLDSSNFHYSPSVLRARPYLVERLSHFDDEVVAFRFGEVDSLLEGIITRLLLKPIAQLDLGVGPQSWLQTEPLSNAVHTFLSEQHRLFIQFLVLDLNLLLLWLLHCWILILDFRIGIGLDIVNRLELWREDWRT